MVEKSIETVSKMIESKISMMLIELLPTPSCPRKKQHNDWKIEQVKKLLSRKLGHPGLSIKVEI